MSNFLKSQDQPRTPSGPDARASWLAGAALLCFVATVLAGGVSMPFPVAAAKTAGSTGLRVGLLLIVAAVALEFRSMERSR